MTTCPKLVESGVYVLGALPPGQRMEYERHLTTCAECRAEVSDLAVLPGLLGRLDESSVAVLAATTEPAPVTILPTALRRVHQRQRQRRFTAFAGALVAACLALVIVLLIPAATGPTVAGPRPSQSIPASSAAPTPPVRHIMTPLGGETKLAADVSLTSTTGGTRVELICRYLGSRPPEYHGVVPRFSLVLISVTGAKVQEVSTWSALPGDVVTVPAMSWWQLSNIARVELRAADGTPLMRYTVP